MRTFLIAFILGVFVAPFAIAHVALGFDQRIDGQTTQKTDVAFQSPRLPSQLQTHILVSDSVIRLGDIFTNAGTHAEKAIAYAPEPGSQTILNARGLYRVARAYRLDWRPLGAKTHAVVERESVRLNREDITDAVLAALIEKGAADDMEVEILRGPTEIHVPGGALTRIGVADSAYDPRSGRFTAMLQAPVDHPAAKKFRVSGRLHRLIDLPVPARRLKANERISARDIAWQRMRADRVPTGALTAEEDVIGFAGKRTLQAGRPIRGQDVQRPLLVKRNALVTIVLKVNNMSLTAQGRSMDSGALDDTVRIKNSQSGKVVDAIVVGDGKVAVQMATQVAVN